jgi:DNA-binding transcriptional regulator YhcF (GntR family)
MPEERKRTREINAAVVAIRRRVLDQLHLGILAPGAKLPSVRDMAATLQLPAKAVLVAYRILEGESLVSIRSRTGVFVGERRPFADQSPDREWLVDALIDARRNGVPPAKAARFLERNLAAVQLRAAVLDRNDDQLWSISDELYHEYGIAATPIDLDGLGQHALPTLPAAVSGADLVVTTAFEHPVIRELSRAGIRVCAATMCVDIYAEVRRLLATRDVYFVVADRRLAAKLHAMFNPAEYTCDLHVLVIGRDDLTVPFGAPVYLTRLTRQTLAASEPDHPLLRRTVAEARVFSEETARELTRLVVAANASPLPST